MNCGGIPDGEFSQVVDPTAPEQFLSMYTQIVENRFAFAVTGLLKMNAAFMEQLTEFCTHTGKNMQLPAVENINQAFEIFDSFILDGMPDSENKKILSKDEKSISWEIINDNHKSAWEKANGNVENYYNLLKCFLQGLFSSSNICVNIENNNGWRFIIELC